MKKLFLNYVLILCTLMVMFTFTACGNSDGSSSGDNKVSLVGAWEYEGGGYTYTFNDDGTGDYDISGTKMEFTYTDKGSSVEILYDGVTEVSIFEYTISGDTLTIKDSFGSDVVYKKK